MLFAQQNFSNNELAMHVYFRINQALLTRLLSIVNEPVHSNSVTMGGYPYSLSFTVPYPAT